MSPLWVSQNGMFRLDNRYGVYYFFGGERPCLDAAQMFFFRKKQTPAEGAEGEEKKEKAKEDDVVTQEKAPVNNPFQNIQKGSQEGKTENDLLQHDIENEGESKKKKENKKSLEGKVLSGEKNEKELSTQVGKAGNSEHTNGQATHSKVAREEGTPPSSNNIRRDTYRLFPTGMKKKKINLYSSSSSSDASSNEDLFIGKSKGKMETLKGGKYNQSRKDRREESQRDNHVSNGTTTTNPVSGNSKIFANVASGGEKLIFLTKRDREEMKRKADKRENEKIPMEEEDHPRGKFRGKEVEDAKRRKREIDTKTDAKDDRHRVRRNSESNEEVRRRKLPNGDSTEEQNDGRSKTVMESRFSGTSTYTKVESSLAELNMLNISAIERESQREKELEIIKQQYLGLNKKKKKMQKPSEKFRNIFNFEWDQSEDTSRNDTNPLYQNRLEPQLLFGRGYIAGIDVREQRKKNNFYDKLVQNRINFSVKKGAMEDSSLKKDLHHRGGTKTSSNSEHATSNHVGMSDLANTPNPMEHLTNPNNHSLSRSKTGEFIYEPKVNNIIVDVHNKHWSEKKREEMTDRDWRIFREDNEIYIKGGIVPAPIRRWEESNLSNDLLKAIKKAKYEKPTPIQMQAIPIALEMRDLIGIAETGSGKTAAFVLPMLSYVKQLPPLTYETSQDGPYALIIAPSRELAIQIFDETNKFASYCSCRTVAVVGGRNAEAQAFELRKGVEIIIGTPGRIQDCLEKAYTVLNQCNYVILDEADRMMDMGFEESVHFILDKIPTSNLKSEDEALALQEEMMAKAGHRLYRLTQMFSATMPPAVERLSRKYLRAPAYISIGDPGAGKRSIEQKLEFTTEGKKKQKLQEILEVHEPPIIVFVNQKKVADIIAKSISKMKFRAVALHGGKAQELREQTLNSFKNGDFDILVATDVAGRGIDVQGVKLVINFDMPKDIESYTHRIGRTGRAGQKGLAISFITEQDSHLFYDLKQFLISSNNIVPMELANNPASKVKPGSVMHTPKKAPVVFKG
ncbi:Snrnp protein [Plasmodium coatneyi]|uniref:RNA helicase n=1 Tax=Plasmodium coatneyi TaxID=208452 RepID=A0A1B1E1R2_9APIC|nr:Snrnp protein [Plasmodium coatneyi]ANQ08827.1 Snrnp protein [Plasmodium coatneyi]